MRWKASHVARTGQGAGAAHMEGPTASAAGSRTKRRRAVEEGDGGCGRPKRAAHVTRSVAKMDQRQDSSGGTAGAAAVAAAIPASPEDLRAEENGKRRMPARVSRVTESMTRRVTPEDVVAKAVALAEDFGAVPSAQETVCCWVLDFLEVHCLGRRPRQIVRRYPERKMIYRCRSCLHVELPQESPPCSSFLQQLRRPCRLTCDQEWPVLAATP